MLGLLLTSLTLGNEITIAAVGDVMLGRWVAKRIEREGVNSVFKHVSESLKSADLRLCNLENVLGDEPFQKKKRFLLKSPAKYGEALAGRFDVVSVANNHSLDSGKVGLDTTLATLARYKVQAIGQKHSSLMLSQKGIKVGIFAFSEFEEPEICTFADFKEWVSTVRPKADILVVSVHWGIELSSKPSSLQLRLAKELADSGVDLVIGHHPHALQPVEWVKGSTGRRTLVAYSLGNFVFDAPEGIQRETGILKVKATKEGIQSYKLEPAKIEGYFPKLIKKAPLR